MAKARRRGADARVVRARTGRRREADRFASAWEASEDDGRRRREGSDKLETVYDTPYVAVSCQSSAIQFNRSSYRAANRRRKKVAPLVPRRNSGPEVEAISGLFALPRKVEVVAEVRGGGS